MTVYNTHSSMRMSVWDLILIPHHILFTTVCNVQRRAHSSNGKRRLRFNSQTTRAFVHNCLFRSEEHKHNPWLERMLYDDNLRRTFANKCLRWWRSSQTFELSCASARTRSIGNGFWVSCGIDPLSQSKARRRFRIPYAIGVKNRLDSYRVH